MGFFLVPKFVAKTEGSGPKDPLFSKRIEAQVGKGSEDFAFGIMLVLTVISLVKLNQR